MSASASNKHTRLLVKYVVTDFVTSNLAMLIFNVCRLWLQHNQVTLGVFYTYPRVLLGQLFFPLLLMFFYWLSGYYNQIEVRSRAHEALTTLSSSALGALSIFLLAMVNDSGGHRLAYEYLATAFASIFVCVYAGRYVITSFEIKGARRKNLFYEAVMLGTDAEAVDLARRINNSSSAKSVRVITLVRLDDEGDVACNPGEFEVINQSDVVDYCRERHATSLIYGKPLLPMGAELARLLRLTSEVNGALYVSPALGSLALTSRRMFNVVGEPLVCISAPNISNSTLNFKRTVDVVGALLALVVLSPLFLALAIGVKRDSKGPVFFTQRRLGYGGKPFSIIKFRTMVQHAEQAGQPQLTSDNDPRITRFGRFLRRYRLDELPQFWNVLRGEMSLVGPRPERSFFAGQIAARVPQYPFIYQVRPGITSWGMVRFGYASNVDEMVERLRYDLIYIENVSFLTDLKILLHTIHTVLTGKGK